MPATLREKIVSYIRTNRQARVSDLVRNLTPISRVSVHRHLKRLTDEGILARVGKPPIVFYVLAEKKQSAVPASVPQETKRIIDQNYLYITPQGQILSGYEGFATWAANTNQSDQIIRLAPLYTKTLADYEKYRTAGGWIDATFKLTETFRQVFLDKLLYADFYSLPQFGKTKLGTLMLYAKQSQNRELANRVCLNVKPLVEAVIKKFKVDAVAFIPPSIPRNVQFMTELAVCLNLKLPHIALAKTRTGQVIVAQKTLEKLEERVVNARDTIFVKGAELPFSNILLVDDAVGSGASMNETAKKLRELQTATGKPGSRVIGFAIVGSYKKFEVIREV